MVSGKPAKAKSLFPGLHRNKHLLYNDEEILENITKAEQLDDLLKDCNLQFKESKSSIESHEFQQIYFLKLQEVDKELQKIFDSTLPYCPRILGVILVNTHYTFTSMGGLQLFKTTNSVYCLRPNTKKVIVSDEIMRKAYEIVYPFNEKPFIKIM